MDEKLRHLERLRNLQPNNIQPNEEFEYVKEATRRGQKVKIKNLETLNKCAENKLVPRANFRLPNQRRQGVRRVGNGFRDGHVDFVYVSTRCYTHSHKTRKQARDCLRRALYSEVKYRIALGHRSV